jgi:enoyl-CoA hydratase
MALCADIVIASEDAQIGTPYSRVWGCYLTGIWLYRLGLTRAKQLALSGRALSGKEAAEIGLINKAVPFDQLEDEVHAQARELAQIPLSQLAAMKLIVNQAYENMGLHSTQLLGPIETAASEGVAAAIQQRDGPPFDDYSQAPPERQPRRDHVIKAESR